MVLEIKLSNFFSINEEVVLDLRAGKINTKRAKDLATNVISRHKEKVLKSTAIYGANASGKSSIMKAINFCCRMVFESHQHNENTVYNFKPFKFNSPQKPSTFFIRFVDNNIEYEYFFSLMENSILKESLFYYPNGRRARVFERDEEKDGGKRDKYVFSSAISRPLDVAQNTSDKTLYVSRASQMDKTIAKRVFNFFYNKIVLGYWQYKNDSLEELLTTGKSFLLNSLQIADSDIVDIKYEKEAIFSNFFTKDVMVRHGDKINIKTYHKSGTGLPFDFDSEESEGTKRLFFILLAMWDVIKNDKFMLIDELETSLHTSIVEFIINLFHSSKGSQLVFSTHDTNLLDLNKMRRDQIYFVNKNDKGASDLYSLYDFKDFRENMDAEKGYLKGRFDAIPFIDLSKSVLNDLVFHE